MSWTEDDNSAHTIDIEASEDIPLLQSRLLNSAKIDLTGSTGGATSELTQRENIDIGDTLSFEVWVNVDSITGSPEIRLVARSLDASDNVLSTSSMDSRDSETAGDWVLLKVEDYDVPSAGRSITISWSAPSDDGGSAVTGYHIRYRIGTNSWTEITTGISGTSHTISGLHASTEYEIQVRAVNIVNPGPWSSSATITTGN